MWSFYEGDSSFESFVVQTLDYLTETISIPPPRLLAISLTRRYERSIPTERC